jgi:hypothetical protein
MVTHGNSADVCTDRIVRLRADSIESIDGRFQVR